MLKKEELASGCFAKAADDEPLFVLRGTDILAPALVRTWAAQFLTHNSSLGISYETRVKYREAMDLARAMEEWPSRKLPD